MRRGSGSHQPAEDDGEEVEVDGCIGEAPEEERGKRAPHGAEEHDPRVREAVREVAEDDLADDARGVEEREHDRRRQRRRDGLRERCDVERDGEIR